MDQEKLIEQQKVEIMQLCEELKSCKDQMTRPQLYSVATQDLITKQRFRITELERETTDQAATILVLQNSIQRSELEIKIRNESLHNRVIKIEDFR